MVRVQIKLKEDLDEEDDIFRFARQESPARIHIVWISCDLILLPTIQAETESQGWQR